VIPNKTAIAKLSERSSIAAVAQSTIGGPSATSFLR